MLIEQIYTGCLAQGAYYIESDGQAVVIDPLREVEPYIQRAKKNGAAIKYVLETHFHADFVSGHIDLAHKTKASIVYGPTAQPAFPAIVASVGQLLKVGNVTFKVLHTPGHTMESACYLLIDENGKEVALFSGDTLFIGDVGRPDLAQKAAGKTKEELAGVLFDSLRNKILPLPDDIIIYPAHGAGSACGKNMSSETTDTLGHQKANNYALRANMTREEFIKEVTTGLMPPPAYFPLNVMMNKHGYESIDTVIERGQHPLSPDAFEAAANETSALIIDTRDPKVFVNGHIPNSINIGIDGGFAPWVGTLVLDIKQPLLIVADTGREEEVIIRLARVGYDATMGYLSGGYNAWEKAGKVTDTITSISSDELADIVKKHHIHLLDVRRKSEYDTEHVLFAENLPLDNINERMAEINKNVTYYVHCASGYRSAIFISILKARGFNNLININGGFKAMKDSGNFQLSKYMFVNTML